MKIVIVSHGSFANGALESVKMICGDNVDTQVIGMYEDINEFERLVSILDDEQIIFFADIPGGHPFNTVYKQILNNKMKQVLIGGFNLPCLIETVIQSNFKTIEEVYEDLKRIEMQSFVVTKNWK